MKITSKIILVFSLLWSITTTVCCVLVITISTWTMMHIEAYRFICVWVIWQMVLSLIIIPVLFILVRDKRFSRRPVFYLAVKRTQLIVSIFFILTMFFEINRYAHFIDFGKIFNPYGHYKSPSGKLIAPIVVSVDKISEGRKAFNIMYETELNIADTLAMREEILYIWRQASIDADKQNANVAAISAGTSSKNKTLLDLNSFIIIFAKDSSGSWRALR